MRVIGIVFIQVLIAVLMAGLVMPAILFSVPYTRDAGPIVLGILVVLLFGLIRVAWPQRRDSTGSQE
jgi:hypothetical protein